MRAEEEDVSVVILKRISRYLTRTSLCRLCEHVRVWKEVVEIKGVSRGVNRRVATFLEPRQLFATDIQCLSIQDFHQMTRHVQYRLNPGQLTSKFFLASMNNCDRLFITDSPILVRGRITEGSKACVDVYLSEKTNLLLPYLLAVFDESAARWVGMKEFHSKNHVL